MPAESQETDRRIGVTVLTGFLGAGKTTLLNRLLRHPQYAGSLVIVNEFGEVGVDHALVREVRDDVVLLPNGCICCTVRGELVDALRQLFLSAMRREIPPFQQIVLETSGLSDASAVLFTLQHDFFLSDRYVLHACIAVVDAERVPAQLLRHPVVRRQIAFADHIAVTRSESDPAAAQRVLQTLAAINPTASIQPVSPVGGVPANLMQAAPYRHASSALIEESDSVRPGVLEGWLGGARMNRAGQGKQIRSEWTGEPIVSFSIRATQLWPRGACVTALDDCLAQMGDSLLRMKGLLRFTGEREQGRVHVVHAVHRQRYPLIAQPARDDAGGAGDGAPFSVVVFIVQSSDATQLEHRVRSRLASLEGVRAG